MSVPRSETEPSPASAPNICFPASCEDVLRDSIARLSALTVLLDSVSQDAFDGRVAVDHDVFLGIQRILGDVHEPLVEMFGQMETGDEPL